MCKGETALAVALAFMTMLAMAILAWALTVVKPVVPRDDEMGASLLEMTEFKESASSYFRPVSAPGGNSQRHGRARSANY